jgi:hypothetical protein
LASATRGEALNAISDARAQSEVRLGQEASAIRRSTEPLLNDALSLPAASFPSGH